MGIPHKLTENFLYDWTVANLQPQFIIQRENSRIFIFIHNLAKWSTVKCRAKIKSNVNEFVLKTNAVHIFTSENLHTTDHPVNHEPVQHEYVLCSTNNYPFIIGFYRSVKNTAERNSGLKMFILNNTGQNSEFLVFEYNDY